MTPFPPSVPVGVAKGHAGESLSLTVVPDAGPRFGLGAHAPHHCAPTVPSADLTRDRPEQVAWTPADGLPAS